MSGLPLLEKSPCPCCGGPVTRACRVTGMKGHMFCGINCHDTWDRVFNGVDRRSDESEVAPLDMLATLRECRNATIETCALLAEATQPVAHNWVGVGVVEGRSVYHPNPYAAAVAARLRSLKEQP